MRRIKLSLRRRYVNRRIADAYQRGVEDTQNALVERLKDKLSPITYEQHECVSIEDVLAAIKGENK